MRLPFSRSSAILPLLSVMLAAHSVNAQEARRQMQMPQSIIHLAPAPRLHGQVVAPGAKDALFDHLPDGYHVFAAASVGQDAGVELLTLNFDAATRLTKIWSKTKDFVIEPAGTCREGHSYAKGDSCGLMVRFAPQGPGRRSGSIRISHSAEVTPMFVGLAGNGYSPVVSFTPSQITTVAGTSASGKGTIISATNLAVDGGDILYIPDVGNKLIKKVDSSGAINITRPVFAVPQSLVADSAGFIYSLNTPGSTYYFSFYSPYGSESAYGTTYAPGSCTPSAPCPLNSVGMSKPASISIDPYDNLFFAEGTKGAAEMPVASISGGSGSLNLWYLTNQYLYGNQPSVAVDGSDNIYNFYNYSTSTCLIQSESLYNAEYSPVAKRVAGGTTCGFSGDGGQARGAEISKTVGQITFDVAGNLYFADAGNQRIRRIDAATGIISTIAGKGTAGYSGDNGAATTASISNPTGLAVDSQGQVFILSSAPTAATTQVVRKVNTTGYWNFGSQQKGSTSTTKLFNVANTGNSALTLAANAAISGSSDFKIDTSVTNCVLTAGSTIAAGRSCSIGIKFAPSATGTRSATLTLLDNTVTGSNTILLSGAGVLPSPTVKITSPASSSSVKKGATITFAVSVTSTTSTKPTGTVTFKVNGSNIGNAVTVSSSGVASTTFTESSTGSYSLSATYNGDTNYAPATVSENLTVTASAIRNVPTVTIAQNTVSGEACSSSPIFQIRVSSTSGDIPTGTVHLKSGSTVLASSVLHGGTALLSTGKVLAGSYKLIASYEGDSEYSPAASSTLNRSAVCHSAVRD